MKVMLLVVLFGCGVIHAGLLFVGGLYLIETLDVNLLAEPFRFLLLTLLGLAGVAYFPLVVRVLLLKLPTDDLAARRSRRGRAR